MNVSCSMTNDSTRALDHRERENWICKQMLIIIIIWMANSNDLTFQPLFSSNHRTHWSDPKRCSDQYLQESLQLTDSRCASVQWQMFDLLMAGVTPIKVIRVSCGIIESHQDFERCGQLGRSKLVILGWQTDRWDEMRCIEHRLLSVRYPSDFPEEGALDERFWLVGYTLDVFRTRN